MVQLSPNQQHALLLGAIPDWLPWAVVGAGVALLGAVLMGSVLASRRAAHRAHPADPKADNAEMKDLTAGVLAELDRRTRELERLIAAADERIDALRRAPRDATPRTDARAARTRE
ncbi:MAG: hypothetical protein JNJ48_05045, partial [Phycisphaerae bacterium]|nr:hypothetical protein [Phycisphaerae bacterium]